jgi:hypothetical protein
MAAKSNLQTKLNFPRLQLLYYVSKTLYYNTMSQNQTKAALEV